MENYKTLHKLLKFFRISLVYINYLMYNENYHYCVKYTN